MVIPHFELGLGERFVEDEGVDQDGHGHAAGLAALVVALAEDFGDFGAEVVAGVVGVLAVELALGGMYAVFEGVDEAFDALGGDGSALGEHGEVADIAAQPAGLGEAFDLVAGGGGVEGVFEGVGSAEGGASCFAAGLFADVGRVDEGDGALDCAAGFFDGFAEAGAGVVFGAGVVVALGFDHDGPAGGFEDQDVGASGAADEGVALFGEDAPAGGAEFLEDVAERDVDGVFVGGHGGSVAGVGERVFGVPPLWGDAVGFPFSPLLWGGMPEGRGGGSADARAPPLSLRDISPRWGEKITLRDRAIAWRA